MTVNNDPRPVLREELARVFKNQRVIRAFEKIFDLTPPEFISQQILIETATIAAELADSRSAEALSAVERLTSAIEQLAAAPPTLSVPLDDNLAPTPEADYHFGRDGIVEITPTSNVVIASPVSGQTLILNCLDGEAALRAISGAVDVRLYAYPTGTIGVMGTVSAHDFVLWYNAVEKLRLGAARVTFSVPASLKSYTVATLPAGAQGDLAYVTDALAPAFNTAIVGGGAAKIPVFYNGAAWVAI